FLLGGEAELPCELRIERRNCRGGAVVRLRGLFETSPGGNTPTLAPRSGRGRALPRKRERGRRRRCRGKMSFVSAWRLRPGALSRLRGRVGWGQAKRSGAGGRSIALRHVVTGPARRCPRAMNRSFTARAAVF